MPPLPLLAFWSDPANADSDYVPFKISFLSSFNPINHSGGRALVTFKVPQWGWSSWDFPSSLRACNYAWFMDCHKAAFMNTETEGLINFNLSHYVTYERHPQPPPSSPLFVLYRFRSFFSLPLEILHLYFALLLCVGCSRIAFLSIFYHPQKRLPANRQAGRGRNKDPPDYSEAHTHYINYSIEARSSIIVVWWRN